ncbi:MAG TPA: response regulator, partial [Candidatus Hydrogenedentes bacterium]|nr:response regulator [Candidatus Hydrogenedentota bacterium]
MQKQRILVTEDDQVQREIIADILEYAGYEVRPCSSGAEALKALQEENFHVLLTDMKMPGMDGLELLQQAKRQCPDLDTVVMTAHATIKTAVTAIKEGAADYLEKPFGKDELLLVMDRTLERGRLRRENALLSRLVDDSVSLGNIIGQSHAMREVYERTRRAVQVPSTVLIQ